MEELVAKQIVNPLKKEPGVTPLEMKVYSCLIHKNELCNDDCEVAKDLYDQLIDNHEEDSRQEL